MTRQTLLTLLLCLVGCGGNRTVLDVDCRVAQPTDPLADCHPLNPPKTYPAVLRVIVNAETLGDRPGAERVVPIDSLVATVKEGSVPVCTIAAPDCSLGTICTIDIGISGPGTCALRFDAQTNVGPTDTCDLYGWDTSLDQRALTDRMMELCYPQ